MSPTELSSTDLLDPDEPAPVWVERASGASPILLTCDHAGARIPRRLENLGLAESDLQRHIALDIGALAVARRLSEILDACLIAQLYSRLVIDCNRPLNSPESIATASEHTTIPGNEALPPAEAALRAKTLFLPYHARIEAELDARAARGQGSALVAIHSFTPVYKDVARRWHAGVLYNRDARLARPMLEALRQQGIVVGDNEPYSVGDETDYAIPIHGERRGIPHVELEIRQDLIGDVRGQQEWAQRIAQALTYSLLQVLAPATPA